MYIYIYTYNIHIHIYIYTYTYTYAYTYTYRVSQEECARLREGVPYVKVYRYNPKHLCPKLNGYGDNGQRSLKPWHLLHTYWLPNTYWNWQEYVVSVMLISVLNIKLTFEWHKAIKLNYKNTRTHVIVVLRVPSTIHANAQRLRNMADCSSVASVSWITVIWHHTQGRKWIRLSADRYSVRTRKKTTLFSGHYLRNRSTLDIGVRDYIGTL